MKRLSLLLIMLLGLTLTGFSQSKSINQKDIQTMQENFSKDANNIMRMNAISNNSIKKIALSRQNLYGIDHNFKYKVKVSGITDQKSSGRCWLFTSLNVIRAKVIEKYNLSSFEFSQNYVFFWDQFEKSNLFLEMIVAHANEPIDSRYNQWLFGSPIGDGGVWSSFANLVDKYGLVPSTVMPETHNSDNTSYMSKLINRKLREFALDLRKMHDKGRKESEMRTEKLKMLSTVYKMLVFNLGVPPKNFNYRFVNKDNKIGETKKYTPQEFAKEVLPNTNYSNYIMLMNDPTREYYKLYEIENDRNVMEGKNWIYINLPNNDFKKFALASIKGNDAIYASCDVGKQLNNSIGLSDINNYDYASAYGITFNMNKKQRILSKESGSSHGMNLVACDVDANENPIKWQFENSWGASSGHNGYLTFTSKWFDEYMFRIVVLKKYLPEKVLKVLKQEPTILPPWDPMFKSDN